MRKRDVEAKNNPERIYSKAAKTISFDTIVLTKLEEVAARTGQSVSKIVNGIVKRTVMQDPAYFGFLAKEHYLEWKKNQYLREQAQAYVETR